MQRLMQGLGREKAVVHIDRFIMAFETSSDIETTRIQVLGACSGM
jgi:hypothetical protein